jgi:hypothetical protein
LTRVVDTVRAGIRDKLHDWGWNWEHSDWSSWKTFSPAAGSAIAHIAVFGVLIGVTTAFSEPPPAPIPRVMEVSLVAETPPPPPPELTAPQPRAPAPSEPDATSLPDRAPLVPKKRPDDTSSASAPTSASEGIYIPPSPLKPGVAGLASLMGSDDPCRTAPGKLKVKDCPTEVAGKFKEAAAFAQMSEADKEKYYGAFNPDCPWLVGCPEGEWRSLIGTRAVARPPPGSRDDRGSGTPQAMGGAGLGGLSDSVGRLGFNPDYTDPAFGD